MLRGNHREPLFGTVHDREILNEIVADVLERMNARIHAFCWMSNHLHFLVQVSERPLGNAMQRIAMRYSRYRHKVLDTTGHLFERRYKAKLVDVDEYFITLLRYIHMNPVQAGITAKPSDYRWSGHRAYLGAESIPWLTTSFGLSMFSSDLGSARKAYESFVLEYASDGASLSDIEHPEDSRVIGSDQFVSSLPEPVHPVKSALSLEQVAEAVCAEFGISIALLRSKSAARYLTPIRLHVLNRAVQERIGTLSEVARFLNRNPSTLARLSQRKSRKGQ
jgi:putative transposase